MQSVCSTRSSNELIMTKIQSRSLYYVMPEVSAFKEQVIKGKARRSLKEAVLIAIQVN